MTRPDTSTAWERFWNAGGWWKALLLAVAYIAAYQGVSLLLGPLFGGMIDAENLFDNPRSVFFALAVPVIVGSVLLLLFARSVGWMGELFGPQPLNGRGWMWIAPVVVALAVVLRAAGTDYATIGVGTVLVTYLAGLFIGLSEELLTRGLAGRVRARHARPGAVHHTELTGPQRARTGNPWPASGNAAEQAALGRRQRCRVGRTRPWPASGRA
ncbi:hypothetical protein [Saccharothrix variisporea]|uniref:CAAX prenyl protease-like protein n=1 Tax=Saccharothrix variisporea TaxID=543527 RepID=A0A495X823_9PSEU|nr:hypothetical protein [Saccharothrix variisporea]RKT69526.1 hypothetical protein DFJ66_2757 [Saccharothrix variisporea]